MVDWWLFFSFLNASCLVFPSFLFYSFSNHINRVNTDTTRKQKNTSIDNLNCEIKLVFTWKK
jgi:hypothetical protein